MIDIGSAIGAGIDQMTQLTNTGLNIWNTWRTNEQAYDQAKKLWNLNNEYNRPINQMKRLEEAGLNPYLVYGNGSVVGNTSSQPSSPSVQGAKFDLDPASSILFGKELKKINSEQKALDTKNKILDYQLRNLRYNSNLFKDAGLPTTSSWWSPYLFGLFKDNRNVNVLKSVGRAISDFLWNNNGKFFKDDEYPEEKSGIELEWNKNGLFNREFVD